jgi:hypothetical protein
MTDRKSWAKSIGIGRHTDCSHVLPIADIQGFEIFSGAPAVAIRLRWRFI